MLVELGPADIAEVMRIERIPEYAELIGQFSAEEHAAAMASPDARYLGWREGGRLAGFVIFQKFREPAVQLRRIAVAEAGRGAGTALFRAAVDWAFANSAAERVRLGVVRHNARARQVYLRQGFEVYETRETSYQMEVTRAAWAARG